MKPLEKIHCQLNSTALDKSRHCLKCDIYDQVGNIEYANVLWEKLSILFEGTTTVQRKIYESAKNGMHMFVVQDGESLSDASARIISLRENIQGLGCDKFNDRFRA